MSPAIAFISPLGRREFISDIYLHGKKTESGQNVFCVPAHVATAVQILMNKRTVGRRELWYQGACRHHLIPSPPAPLSILPSSRVSPGSALACAPLSEHSPD